MFILSRKQLYLGIWLGACPESALHWKPSKQTTKFLVKIEGMINNQPISILIDPGAILSYIGPRIVDLCNLVPEKFDKSWLVQLAMGTK